MAAVDGHQGRNHLVVLLFSLTPQSLLHPPARHSRIPAARSRIGASARAASQSEPSSPRGASSGSLLGEDGPVLLDELLPPGLPGEGDAFWAAVGAGGSAAASGAPTPSSSDNIRVYVRVRPPSSREAAAGVAPCLEVVGGQMVMLLDGGRPDPFTATFDRKTALGCLPGKLSSWLAWGGMLR